MRLRTTDSWAATATTGAPSPRYCHTAVWTGWRMIVWGGLDANNIPLLYGGQFDLRSIFHLFLKN